MLRIEAIAARHSTRRRLFVTVRLSNANMGDPVMSSSDVTPPRPRVVIIGAGFAGLSAAKALHSARFDVTVIDQHNYHLFQPLLYQVATAGLSPGDIASPIRGILHRQRNTRVVLAKVSDI